MSKVFKPVYVEWEDAGSPEAAWMDIKEIKAWQKERTIVKSVGFLLKENKKFIVIAADNMDDDVFNGITKIPTTWIRKIVYLDMFLNKSKQPKK